MSQVNTAQRRLLITAGPTREPIDSVRYIGNRSSGRMGIELARAAEQAGWEVTLLLGPGTVSPPAHVRVFYFESTADLQRLLEEQFLHCDVLIMASAVADYRPRVQTSGKMPRGGENLTLELEPTPDLLRSLVDSLQRQNHPSPYIVGFALEEADQMEARASDKLQRKAIDAIVANPLQTMDASTIQGVMITRDGRRHTPPTSEMSKHDFADWLISCLQSDCLSNPCE